MYFSAKRSQRAFTLVELLVVISVIVALLAIGAVSLSGMLSRSVLKQAQQEVAGALMFARQTAITRGSRCIAEIVAINNNSAARPTSPGTPYTLDTDGAADCVRICALKQVRNAATGALQNVLDPGVLREIRLSSAMVFDDERGTRRWYPANESLAADMDGDGVIDAAPVTRVFLCFEADGSCTASGAADAPPGSAATFVRLKDLSSGDTGGVFVFPTTGVVKLK